MKAFKFRPSDIIYFGFGRKTRLVEGELDDDLVYSLKMLSFIGFSSHKESENEIECSDIFGRLSKKVEMIANEMSFAKNVVTIKNKINGHKKEVSVPDGATHLMSNTHDKVCDPASYDNLKPLPVKVYKSKTGELRVAIFHDGQFQDFTKYNESNMLIKLDSIGKENKKNIINEKTFISKLIDLMDSNFGNIFHFISLNKDSLEKLFELKLDYDELIDVFKKKSFFTIQEKYGFISDFGEINYIDFKGSEKYNINSVSEMLHDIGREYAEEWGESFKMDENKLYHKDCMMENLLAESINFRKLYNQEK